MADFKDFNDLASQMKSKGAEAYYVGGYPRDKSLGQPSKDIDVVVTGLSTDDMINAFPSAKLMGREFGIFEVYVGGVRVELALARTERKSGTGYRGFTVFSSPSIEIEQDLLRRDLTINAIAIHILSGKVIDPYGGREDLKNGVIRAVSLAFGEDPLRVYRAARFAARFGFIVEDETLMMMHSLKDELASLSVERVAQELISALNTKKPSQFFDTLRKADVLDVHYKEVNDLYSVPQSPEFHPEGDAAVHTMIVVDKAANMLDSDTKLIFSALVHDLGKALTPTELLPKHPGHEEAGIPLVRALATRLKLPKQLENAGAFGAEHHGKVHRVTKMRSIKIVDLINAAVKSPLGIKGLVNLSIADTMGVMDTDAHHLIDWAAAIASVKANSELPVLTIAEDKRVRQAKLLESLRN